MIITVCKIMPRRKTEIRLHREGLVLTRKLLTLPNPADVMKSQESVPSIVNYNIYTAAELPTVTTSLEGSSSQYTSYSTNNNINNNNNNINSSNIAYSNGISDDLPSSSHSDIGNGASGHTIEPVEDNTVMLITTYNSSSEF